MNFKLGLVSIFAVSLGIFATPSVHASIIADYNGGAQSGENFYDGDILTTDLINGGQSSLTSGISGANDGAASSGDLSHDVFLTNPSGDSLTFDLNLNPLTGGSATGYTITQIQTISGWAGAGFAAQRFELTIRTLSDPTGSSFGTFENSVGAINAGIPQSSKTTLTDSTGAIATGVTSLTFTYTPVTSVTFGTVVREIDVSTAVVPEPSTYFLILGGMGVLALRLRRVSSK